MATVPLMTSEQLPAFSDLYMLDTVLARLQVTLDDACKKGDIDLRSCDAADLLRALDITADQLPISGLLTVIQALAHATRYLLRILWTGVVDMKVSLSHKSTRLAFQVLAL